jgi:hypothetical protein
MDVFADSDSLSGSPIYDLKSPAQRWLNALHHGPEMQGATHLHLTTTPIFGPVGAGTNPKQQ